MPFGFVHHLFSSPYSESLNDSDLEGGTPGVHWLHGLG